MDAVDIEIDLEKLRIEIPIALEVLENLRVSREIKKEFNRRYNAVLSANSVPYKWKKLSDDLKKFINENASKAKKSNAKKSKEKPEVEKKPEKGPEKKSIEEIEQSLREYYNMRLERLEDRLSEEAIKRTLEGQKRRAEEKEKLDKEKEKRKQLVRLEEREQGYELVRIKKLTRRRPVDKIKIPNAPIIETWFNSMVIDPELSREAIESERRNVLDFVEHYQGVQIPETHQQRFITSTYEANYEPTREEIANVVLSEIGEEEVKEQIRDMEKSGLIKGLMSLYAEKQGGGPRSESFIFELADNLRKEEKKDINNLQNEIKDPENLLDIQGKMPIVLDNLHRYILKAGDILYNYIIPVGVGVGIGDYLSKKNNTTTQSTNTLLTHQYYSNTPPPPLGEFGPPQGHIISRRGPAVYLKPFTQKYEIANKQREEALRQRDIEIKKSIM